MLILDQGVNAPLIDLVSAVKVAAVGIQNALVWASTGMGPPRPVAIGPPWNRTVHHGLTPPLPPISLRSGNLRSIAPPFPYRTPNARLETIVPRSTPDSPPHDRSIHACLIQGQPPHAHQISSHRTPTLDRPIPDLPTLDPLDDPVTYPGPPAPRLIFPQVSPSIGLPCRPYPDPTPPPPPQAIGPAGITGQVTGSRK